MTKITVLDKIGPRCLIKEHGQLIYDAIHTPLENNEQVVLDFTGVTQFASPFFNFAVGKLLKNILEPDLRRLLILENLNEVGHMVVERVIENATKCQMNKDYEKIVTDILAQQAKESE